MTLIKAFLVVISTLIITTVCSQSKPDSAYLPEKKYFSGIFMITDDIIPYHEKGKWGWMQKTTLRAITKPVFDYTNFRTPAGLAFGLHDMDFTFTIDKQIIRTPKEDYTRIEMMNIPTTGPDISGFQIEEGMVTLYSDKYTDIDLIPRDKHNSPNRRYAIVTDQNKLKGIVSSLGDTLTGFGFNYSDIEWYINMNDEPFFIAKKSGQDYFLIYDSKGLVVFEKPFTDHKGFDLLVQSRNNSMGYSFREAPYKAIKIHDKWYVMDRFIRKLRFVKGYDDIIRIDGPTFDNIQGKDNVTYGIYPEHFLVREGKDLFYVDLSGNEYRVRK